MLARNRLDIWTRNLVNLAMRDEKIYHELKRHRDTKHYFLQHELIWRQGPLAHMANEDGHTPATFALTVQNANFLLFKEN